MLLCAAVFLIYYCHGQSLQMPLRKAAQQLFDQRPDLTVLELGSLFDPWLINTVRPYQRYTVHEMNKQNSLQSPEICEAQLTQEGGFGNALQSFWFAKSICFWNDFNLKIATDEMSIIHNQDSFQKYLLPPTEQRNVFGAQLSPQQKEFVKWLCAGCIKPYYPWDTKHVFCYYNRWYLPIMGTQTSQALAKYYENNNAISSIDHSITINADCDVAIHIRCGDMLSAIYAQQKNAGLFTLKYYIESILFLLEISHKTEQCLHGMTHGQQNIFLICQIRQKWTHGVHERIGGGEVRYLSDFCNGVIYGIQRSLATRFNSAYSVNIINNHLMNDFELMLKVPFLITAQSTLSYLAAFSRRISSTNEANYVMIAPYNYGGRIDDMHDDIAKQATKLNILPSNHIFAKQVFQIDSTYMISKHTMHHKYNFLRTNASHKDLLNIITSLF